MSQAAGDLLELSPMHTPCSSYQHPHFPTHRTPAWLHAPPPSLMPRPPQRSGPAARHRCRQRRPHPALHPSPPPPAMPLGLQPAQTPVPLPPVIERSCEGKQTQVSLQGPCTCVPAFTHTSCSKCCPGAGECKARQRARGEGVGFGCCGTSSAGPCPWRKQRAACCMLAAACKD